MNEKFGKNGFIQNSPNCPNLAFPFEDLWGIIKLREKRRELKSKEKLKIFKVQENIYISLSLVRYLFKGYMDRVKKILKLNFSRLETEYPKKRKKKKINK